MNFAYFTIDPFWFWWVIGAYVGFRVIFKLLKALFVRSTVRWGILLSKNWGGSDLRMDRPIPLINLFSRLRR